MGLLTECPSCNYRNGQKNPSCKKCGLNIKKLAHKTYWVEYYVHGKRRRERIGPSKVAAEQRLREVLKARTEDRYIEKDKGASLSLEQISKWYLSLPQTKTPQSLQRNKEHLVHLYRLLGKETKINKLSSGKIEEYQALRLKEPSTKRKGKNTAPATVKHEVTTLKAILNCAVRHDLINQNPISSAKIVSVNNARERILTPDEFDRLLKESAPHLKPIIALAYYSGMRKQEILQLAWDELDLQKGIIRLSGNRTKTKTARTIPLHPRVFKMLKEIPRPAHTQKVFHFEGKALKDIRSGFEAACRRALIKDFTFHDLRHCAINNLRLAGNDYFKIMAISGHKTMSVFKRYNLVTEDELVLIRWGTEEPMDTYMDTKEKKVPSQEM